MKILLIANSIVGEEPGFTGGESRFIEIAKNWQAQGHEIHLMSSSSGKKLCERVGLPVILHESSADTITSRWAFILRTLKMPFVLCKLLGDFTEGIVYSTNEQLYDVLPALYVKLRCGRCVTWATVVHWLPPLLFWRRKSSKLLNSLLFLISERMSVYLAGYFGDRLLAVSASTKEQLLATYVPKRKIFTVECGVNYDQVQSLVSRYNQEYDAIFIKRLQAVKGVFDLIDIWKEIIRVRPNARLLVVGEGIDSDEMKRRIRDNGLDRNILLTGTIYDVKKKYEMLSRSKLFVLPSYEENWAIVIGEAMAAGVPVIAYDLQELRTVWKDHYVPVPTGDVAVFAKKIGVLLDDEEQRMQLSARAKEFVRCYDWRKIAEKELHIMQVVQKQ
jgi:glycosyltransferase involved in cell wall biosynthesis